jgi:hypothetical protein
MVVHLCPRTVVGSCKVDVPVSLLQVLDADARIFLFEGFLTPGPALSSRLVLKL